MPHSLDSMDRSILRALQHDGRLQNVQLAETVGLSPSPCLRRVRRLEEAGILQRYVALVDATHVGWGMTMFARVSLVAQDAETVARFSKAMLRLPQVMECYIMAGECDALLRVVAADIAGYRKFQSLYLTRANEVQTVKTDIPMEKVKQSTELPL